MMGLGGVFTTILAIAGLLSPGAAPAQQAANVARIGLLASDPSANSLREAFIQGLRDLGYVEGRNVMIEYRYSEGHLDRFRALAAELVALKVDVIVASGTPAAPAARDATRALPIVFVAVADPITSGLVTSLARPSALRARAPAVAGRRRRRPGVEAGLARWHTRAGVRAAGVLGAAGGDDAAAGDEPADLSWRVGRTRQLARKSDRVRWGRARGHGLGGTDGSRSGRHKGEEPAARLDLGGADAPGVCH